MKWLLRIAFFMLLPALAWAQHAKFPAGDSQTVNNQGYAAAAITPSDTTKIRATRAIFNGNATACNITMTLNGDTVSVAWTNVQSGQILPVQAILVLATGTTCTGLVAIY